MVGTDGGENNYNLFLKKNFNGIMDTRPREWTPTLAQILSQTSPNPHHLALMEVNSAGLARHLIADESDGDSHWPARQM